MLTWNFVFIFSIGFAVGIISQLLIDSILGRIFPQLKTSKEKIEKKSYRNPCDNCINFTTCKTGCELLEYDEEKLKDLFMEYRCCPDCGCKTLYEGPTGGCSVNVKCKHCDHYFNLALPMFAERIHMDPKTKEFKKGW
jgi:hypothetical protein